MSFSMSTYKPTGSVLAGLRNLQNPAAMEQAENDAWGYAKESDQTNFERGMMQQEQSRRNQETQNQYNTQMQKYKVLGGLLGSR